MKLRGPLPANNPLRSDFGERTINELSLMFKSGQINLDPGFQRKSVWSVADRRRLIQSITSSYPLPSIFLYKRDHNGGLVYDVIDGKQRLETILMFTRLGRFKRQAFDVRLDLPEDDGPKPHSWKDICRLHPSVRHAFESYKIQTVEVTGDLSDIIDLFVRINSTGKPLSSGEKRHARFYNSRFLKEADRLIARNRKFFAKHEVLTDTQLDRMKGTELVSELLMSIIQEAPINKKTALDRAIGNDSVNANTLAKAAREFKGTLTSVGRLFPNLRETRFRRTADFFSLYLLVWEMRRDKSVLNDKKRNRVAARMLAKLSTEVDQLREQIGSARPPKRTPQLITDYLLTVQGDTDSSANRNRRGEILKGVFASLFEQKDSKRLFTPEQKRIIWNSDDKRVCVSCKKPLSWDDFTVDHIEAWIKGGKTKLKNAQLMCRSCNSRKGGR